jgi:hypothetical protein
VIGAPVLGNIDYILGVNEENESSLWLLKDCFGGASIKLVANSSYVLD